MKKLGLLLILLVGILLEVQAQEQSEKSKKELKQEKKEAKKLARQVAQSEAVLKSNVLITSKFWVLEATTLQGKQGSSVINLDPTLNFVIVEQDKGIIQLGLNGLAGWNGVGGVTLEGDITSYDVKPGKTENQPVRLTARFSGPSVNAMLRLTVSGEYGDVVITGNYSNDRITFRGKLVHPNESTVFVGRKTN